MAEVREMKKVASQTDQVKAGFSIRRPEHTKIKMECSLDVPQWNQYYTAPTYCGTDVLEPKLQVPFKCTVPKYLCDARQRALGLPERVPYPGEEPPIPEKPTVYPCWANTIHPAYHTVSRNGKILDYYKFRNTDELQAPPLECQEPVDKPPPPPRPWKDLARLDISKVTGRSHISTYMNDYIDPYGRDLGLGTTDKKILAKDEPKRIEVIEESWPAWPEKIRETICKQTGRVMEPRDIQSGNDESDQNRSETGKMCCSCNCPVKKQSNNSSRIGINPVKDYNMCRCGSFTTGKRNTTKDMITLKQHQKDTIQEAATEVYEKTLPPWSVRNPTGGYRTYVSVKDTLLFDKEHHPYEPTDHSQQFRGFQDDIADRWVDFVTTSEVPDYFTGEQPGPPRRKNAGQLFLDEIEEERQHRRNMQEKSYMEALNKTIAQKSKPKGVKLLRVFPPPVQEWPQTAPVRSIASPAWSPDLKKREEKYTAMIGASDGQKQETTLDDMKEQRTSAAVKIEDHAKVIGEYKVKINPNSVYFTPEIKLPQPKLFEPVKYEGPGSNQRYGTPFKSITAKRFQLMQPEPVPGLRDTRHTYNKELFFGYHSSVFR